jgi:hypothetical protein
MGADSAFLLTDEAFEKADISVATTVLGKAIQKIGDYDLILAGWHAVWWFGILLAVVVLVTFGLVVTAPPRLAQQERKPPGSLGRMLCSAHPVGSLPRSVLA